MRIGMHIMTSIIRIGSTDSLKSTRSKKKKNICYQITLILNRQSTVHLYMKYCLEEYHNSA